MSDDEDTPRKEFGPLSEGGPIEPRINIQKERDERQVFVAETQELMGSLLQHLAEKQADKRVALIALEMLSAYVASDMGMSLEELMNSLASNVPQFYRRWHETLNGMHKVADPKATAVILDIESFRKSKEGK